MRTVSDPLERLRNFRRAKRAPEKVGFSGVWQWESRENFEYFFSRITFLV